MGGIAPKGRRRRYECRSRNDHLGVRCRNSVCADVLEAEIWGVLEENILSFPENLYKYTEAKKRDNAARHYEEIQWQQRITHIGTELESIEVKQQRLLTVYLNGTIDHEMYSRNKSELDLSHKSLEDLRAELKARIKAQDAQQSQIETTISFVQRLADNLPKAVIAERRRVLESLDVHVVVRDLNHMRLFLDIPLLDDPECQDLQQVRWRGLESLQSIDWEDDILSTRPG